MNLRVMITSRVVSVATLGLLCAFSAVAGQIFVNNFSFETLPVGPPLPFGGCGPGCSFSEQAIPGWTNSGVSGQFQPGTPATTFFTTLPAGPTVAFSNVTTPPISQTVFPTVVEGVTYTLMVDLGWRNDFGTFTSAADLMINGNAITAIGTGPTQGNWSTFTATYTGLAADVGSSITIELLTSGGQGDFDNVRLSDSNVPEPNGVTLLGLGLAGLLAFARRKRSA